MLNFVFLFEILTQVILHLLVYVMNACDLKRHNNNHTSKEIVSRRARCTDTSTSFVENIEFNNVFPNLVDDANK